MRRFPVPALPRAAGERVVLEPGPSHHLLRVCRLPRGASLVAFDGEGHHAGAVLCDVRADGRAVLELTEEPTRAAPASPLWVVVSVLKGPAMERALRMGTEAGATHFVPSLCERTVARGDRRRRWERVVQSAAQQCGRADVPEIAPVQPLRAAAASVPAELSRFVAAPGAGAPTTRRGASVAIGPEGGWTDRELDALQGDGWEPIGLGSWVLRADTAVAVAVATLALGA